MAKRIRTDYIIVHCSKTAQQEISYKNVSGKYHFFIERDGKVTDDVRITKRAEHTSAFNDYSVGICMAGGRTESGEPTNNFTEEQMLSLNNLLDNLIQIYPNAKVVGHDEMEKGKKCPGFDLIDYVQLVEEQRARVSYVKEARSRRRGRSN